MTAWIDLNQGGDIWKIFGMAIAGLFVVISYAYSSFKLGKIGVTSEFAALITYIIGVIVMSGFKVIAVILSILMLILLSSKEYLTEWKEKLSREELGNTLKFAFISLVALPLLPDEKYSILNILSWLTGSMMNSGPEILTMKFFNPFGIWLFVVIMAGVEYVGYILSKVMGNKGGIIASWAVGWLISSTATTAAMTNRSVHHPENHYIYATGTLIASCIMFVRVIIISGFYNPSILSTILIPAFIMFLVMTGVAYYYYWKAKLGESRTEHEFAKWFHINRTEQADSYESPFQLIPAMKFAWVVVIIKFLAGLGKIYHEHIPAEIFNYTLGAISWLADVDAITQTMASESVTGNPSLMIASSTILIAVMSNNIVKASIAYRFGEKQFGKEVLTGFGSSIAAGLLVIILMNLIW